MTDNSDGKGVLDLRGAAAIAKFLWADDSKSARRRVYHIATKGDLDIINIGGVLHARSARLLEQIAEREKGHAA